MRDVRDLALPGTGAVLAAAAALGTGTAAGLGLPRLGPPTAVAACAALGLAAGAVGRGARTALAAALVALCCAGAANAAWRTDAAAAHLLGDLAAQGAWVRVCGTVERERPRSVEAGVRSVEVRGRAWRTREPALLAGAEARELRAGERFCALGEARTPRGPRPGPPLVVVDEVQRDGLGSPLRYGASLVRERFTAVALEALPPRQAGLLLGMTTGERAHIDEETLEAFRTTGLAHLVAVSGFHTAVVLGLLAALARVLVPRGRWLRVLIAGPPLVGFAFLTGLQPSVLRATLSAGLVLLVTAAGRETEGLRVLGVVFCLLILASPEMLGRPGFQLSFAATAAILLWARRLAEGAAGLLERAGTPPRAATAVGVLAGTALAAQLGVAPLLALHFGQVPAAGGLANLVAVPLAPVVIGGGLASLAAGALWEPLAWTPAGLLLPLDVILAVADRGAALPGATLDAGLPAALAFSAGAGAVLTRSPRARAVALALALLAAGAAAGRTAAGPPAACPGPEIRALDVGQGTAVLLRAGDAAVLADGGPRGAGVVRALRAHGVRRLDALIASHPHADHTEGLVEVLQAMPVGTVLAPPTIGWGVGRDVLAAAETAEVPVVIGHAGDAWTVGEIRLEALSPEPAPIPEENPALINAYNLVVRARVGGTQVLLPGDADGDLQRRLTGPGLAAPVLVAVHHGSADVDVDFVAAVDPRVTLVTVGMDNRYGHPTERALQLYGGHGPVLRTDLDGEVAVCDGETPEVRRQR